MSDRPNDTLVLTDSPPAHRMLIERPAQQRGLWLIAALLIVVDALLIMLIAVDKTLSPLLVPVLLVVAIVATLGVAVAIMQRLPESYTLFAAGMAAGAIAGLLIYRGG